MAWTRTICKFCHLLKACRLVTLEGKPVYACDACEPIQAWDASAGEEAP